MNTQQRTSPWKLAVGGSCEAICQHICATIEVADDVEVVGATPCTPRPGQRVEHVEVVLQKQGKRFHYKIRIVETGEPSLRASTVLAQLIMNDPLLLKGVSDFECSPTTGFIVFHGHKVDISSYFDGEILQTSAIITEIIRKISSTASTKHVCSIGMVPIIDSVVFLECEKTADGHRFYEEANIRKWISEHGTSPFTRAVVTVADLTQASVRMVDQPTLPTKRESVAVNLPHTKKRRVPSSKHVSLVWDRSGSMRVMFEAARDGLVKTITEQQAIANSTGNTTKLTLTTFDHTIQRPIDEQDISQVDLSKIDEWIQPRGMTRLYDAVISAATRFQKQVGLGESGVFIVMTDGCDTESEARPEAVRRVLKSLQTEKEIECIFMAANIGDAQTVGQTMGFNRETSITFTPEASSAAFESMSQSAFRSITGGSAAFTGWERQVSAMPLRAQTIQ